MRYSHHGAAWCPRYARFSMPCPWASRPIHGLSSRSDAFRRARAGGTPSRHSGSRTAHDHPFACALLEQIHPNEIAARVFSVPDPLFADTAISQRDIAEHLHAHRSKLEGHELVVEGSKIGHQILFVEHLAGTYRHEVVGIDLIEPVHIDTHHGISHVLL